YRGTDLRLPPHAASPDPTDLQGVRAWVKRATGPTAIDLFCGAGGLSLGLRDAGFTVLVGADSDGRAVETHTANVGGLGYVGDLTDPTELLEYLEGWGIDRVDLIAGGVPCQPFSRAGRSMIRSLVESGTRVREDPRAELWQAFMAVVAKVKPLAVLVENVPDLPSWDEGSVLMGFYDSLRELGYVVDARVLDGFQYGVPQHRARLMLIALRGTGAFVWPEPSDEITTLRDAIGDLPPVPPAQRTDRLPYRGARTAFQKRMRKGVLKADRASIYDHITRDIRPDDAEAFELLREGETYDDLPMRLRRYRSDIFTDKYKRLVWAEVSRSITAHIAKDGYWYIHPQQNRTLSVREAARIQTFPDWFRFAGQPSLRLRQIGNAVPPKLAACVGRQLQLALQDDTPPADRPAFDFRSALLGWHRKKRRPYQWRLGHTSPWLVLAGELCLSRTRPELVPAMFESLRNLAPVPAALVSPHAADRLRSLGLGARADILVAVAETLVARHGGHVPEDELELCSLPGVGDYVAQATLCFGFGRRAVLLDATTGRVISRFVGHRDTRRWQLRLDLYQLAGSSGPDAEFNYALLDHGSMICRPERPLCADCPLSGECRLGSERTDPSRLQILVGGVDAGA
ncbi:MAG: DNA (cytosine-5-)-methyltransferase, partial [Chloroflexota bacterium]|nr:DNA (cytosine-5-)-methyltransferase [Chloroflexota bacterium]